MASFGMTHTSTTQDSSTLETDSSTPWIAASDGNLALLQASLKALNLPATASDENGYTLLHAAASYGQVTIIEWLLVKGVQAGAVDHDGDTPLHHVEDVNAAKFLIEKGHANPMTVNAEGKTPLQVKTEELSERMEDDDDDDNNHETCKLRELVGYFSRLSNIQ